MANRLCREIGHSWQPTAMKGWFRCARVGCGAYGACAACVLCVPQRAVSMQCPAHKDAVSVFIQGSKRSEVVRYRVYLWLRRSSQAAEVVQEVQAVSADAAVQVMMRSHALSFVFYVWVVPERESVALC